MTSRDANPNHLDLGPLGNLPTQASSIREDWINAPARAKRTRAANDPASEKPSTRPSEARPNAASSKSEPTVDANPGKTPSAPRSSRTPGSGSGESVDSFETSQKPPTSQGPEFPEFPGAGAGAGLAGLIPGGEMDESEYRLARVIQLNPCRPSARYAKLAGMSSKTAVKARRRLIEKGLVLERKEERSGRGGRSLLLELTSEGVRALHAYDTAEPDWENL